MKIGLSERQLNYILSKIELDEQDNSAPKSGASTTQSGGQGYPQVGKWESGVTRGPANQIGLTKWSDIVKINRGKANTLL